MRVLLDACVLFPTVMRELLIGAADQGLFEPLWSDRILEEWARAAARLGNGAESVARGEIAMMRAVRRSASVTVPDDLIDTLELPDVDDRHVLAAAIEGKADELLTFNLRDFPTRTLSLHGVIRRDPDNFLLEFAQNGTAMAEVAEAVRLRTEAISGRDQPMRPLLKRAKLPRLAKFLG